MLTYYLLIIKIYLISNYCSAFEETIYDYSIRELNGDRLISFEKYRDKCILIVNTASASSLTLSNMMFLDKIGNEEQRRNGIHIAAIPSNTFGSEPKSEPELVDWFKREWLASYDLYGLTDLNQSNLYHFLSRKSGNKRPSFNFAKYLIERDGKTVTRYTAQDGALIDNVLKSLINLSYNFICNHCTHVEMYPGITERTND